MIKEEGFFLISKDGTKSYSFFGVSDDINDAMLFRTKFIATKMLHRIAVKKDFKVVRGERILSV